MGFRGVDKSGDTSCVMGDDAGLAGTSAPAFDDGCDGGGDARTGAGSSDGWMGSFGDGCGGGGGARTGSGSSAGGMGSFGGSLLLSWGGGSGSAGPFTFVDILSRRSCTDLSRTNSMAAARCECSPDEELRMISGNNIMQELFSPFTAKYAISRLRQFVPLRCLLHSHKCIRDMEHELFQSKLKPSVDGTLFSLSWDWIQLKAASQSPVKPT
jgi:hypothetical protein